MINKLMQDQGSGGGKGDLIEFNSHTKKAYLCWDVSGGSSTPRIRLYGSIFPSIVNPDESTTLVTDFLEIFSITGVATGTSGQTLISHIYPKMFTRVTANSGNSRIRVWLAYDGD